MRGTRVDTAPKAINDLPKQPDFKADLFQAAQRQIGLVFIDLDNFKAVNDTKGHQAGDQCLAKVAVTIGSVVAGKGELYRYGGDEFTVILENADVDEAAATGERIRRAIRTARPGDDIGVTASIGIAASDQAGLRDAERLLKAADDAAFASKRTKNCVTKWTDATPTEPDHRATSKERIKRLVELAEFGVHEIQNNRRNVPPEELANTRHEWEDDVLAALEAASATQSEMSWFRVLGTYKEQVMAAGPYRKTVNEVAEKLARLRQIIEQLETRQKAR
jgi:diguanylate cyclase (GGDEF)-like protein